MIIQDIFINVNVLFFVKTGQKSGHYSKELFQDHLNISQHVLKVL